MKFFGNNYHLILPDIQSRKDKGEIMFADRAIYISVPARAETDIAVSEENSMYRTADPTAETEDAEEI